MCGLFKPRLTKKLENGVLCPTLSVLLTLALADILNKLSTICWLKTAHIYKIYIRKVPLPIKAGTFL